MSEMVAFWAALLPLICEFLLTDPIKYVFGIFLLIGVTQFVMILLFPHSRR